MLLSIESRFQAWLPCLSGQWGYRKDLSQIYWPSIYIKKDNASSSVLFVCRSSLHAEIVPLPSLPLGEKALKVPCHPFNGELTVLPLCDTGSSQAPFQAGDAVWRPDEAGHTRIHPWRHPRQEWLGLLCSLPGVQHLSEPTASRPVGQLWPLSIHTAVGATGETRTEGRVSLMLSVWLWLVKAQNKSVRVRTRVYKVDTWEVVFKYSQNSFSNSNVVMR